MTIDAGNIFLAFMFISEGDKLSIAILIAFREDNIEWREKKKKSLPQIGFEKTSALLCPVLITK